MIKYNPTERIITLDALCHPFFNELKEANTKLPDGKEIDSKIFQFSNEELGEQKYRQKIVPEWFSNSFN